MKLLLDFANIRQWDRSAFNAFGEQVGAVAWLLARPAIASNLKNAFRKSDRVRMPASDFLDLKTSMPGEIRVWAVNRVEHFELNEKSVDVIMPDQDRFNSFMAYLGDLGAFWRWIITDTRDSGPLAYVLNHMAKDARLVFKQTANPWTPLAVSEPRVWAIEHRLIAEYLAPFISENGEVFKRVRACADPDCGRLFVYNRPKQTFCNDDCRYHFHNVVKIRSGYMADYQRKGRKENPATYLLK